MSLQTLGYIGLRTKNLEDWTVYAERFLGMQLVDKSRFQVWVPWPLVYEDERYALYHRAG